MLIDIIVCRLNSIVRCLFGKDRMLNIIRSELSEPNNCRCIHPFRVPFIGVHIHNRLYYIFIPVNGALNFGGNVK